MRSFIRYAAFLLALVTVLAAAGQVFAEESEEYTSGDEEVDSFIRGVVEEYTDESMTPLEKLGALYDYMLLHCGYRKGELHEVGEDGWQIDDLKLMISKNLRGNCYGFAAMFRELARAVGFPAEAFSGTVKGDDKEKTPHGWVEIEIDEKLYYFDPEMQYFNQKDMFMMPADDESTIRWKYTR